MDKRRFLNWKNDQATPQIPEKEERIEQEYKRLKAATRPVYLVSKKELLRFGKLGGDAAATKQIKKCLKMPTLDACFLPVKKTFQLTFDIDLREPDNQPPDMIVQRIDSFNPAPETVWERAGNMHIQPSVGCTEYDLSSILLHELALVSYSSDAPFELIVNSNLNDYVNEMVDTIDSPDRMIGALRNAQPLAVPHPEVTERSFVHAQPHSKSSTRHVAFHAHHYLEQSLAAVCAALRNPDTAYNGTIRFTAPDPENPIVQRHWVGFSTGHVLAGLARSSHLMFNLLIQRLPGTVGQGADAMRNFYVVLEETFEMLLKAALNTLAPRAPRFPAHGIAVSVMRPTWSDDVGHEKRWLSTYRCSPRPESWQQLCQRYTFTCELELTYSLQPHSIDTRALHCTTYAKSVRDFVDRGQLEDFLRARAYDAASEQERAENPLRMDELIEQDKMQE